MIAPIDMVKILTAAYIQWPYVKVTDELVQLWRKAFENYSTAEVSKAMMLALKEKTGNGHITIGDVFAALQKTTSTDLVSETEAWSLLNSTIKRFGWPNELAGVAHIESISPKVANAVRALGWRNVCGWKTDDEAANRAHLWRMIRSDAEATKTSRALGLSNGGVQKVGDVVAKLNLGSEQKTIGNYER